MPELNVKGQHNIIKPGFYMPNRLTKATGKALHHLLDGKVCYLVDPTFPPAPEIMAYLRGKQVDIEYFDFRHTTSRRVREQILNRLNAGTSVVFLPGIIARSRGSLADVPSPFLATVGSLHISPVPVFVGHYGNTLRNAFCYDDEPEYREEMRILPHLSSGPQTGERLLAAWLEVGADIFSAHPLLSHSLTTELVLSFKAHANVEITDGMNGAVLPYHRILGVSMTLARFLQKRGEKRVGVILPPGSAGIIAVLSCLLAGITPVMINYSSSRTAFESTIRQSGIKTFISARKFMQKLPNFPWPKEDDLLLVEDLLSKKLSKASLVSNILLARFAPAKLICGMFDTDSHSGDDEGVMLFTSGSSGEPKGVTLTHRMILANVAQCASRLPLADEVFLGSLPIFHSFGLTVTLFLPLLCGFPIVTNPSPTDSRKLNDLIKKHKVTLLCATPTFARAMLRRAEPDTYRSVRYFIVGAEKLQPALEREFREKCGVNLLEGYGLTETTPVDTLSTPNAPLIPGSAFYMPSQVQGSIGAVLPGLAVRITDLEDDSRILPLSEQGMLWYKGANVFKGYIGKPGLNAEILKDGWFKSGDIGSLDLNGFVKLGGRLSRFSKIGGEMVPHEGVEVALTAYLKLTAEDGLQIAVTGISDEKKGEVIVLLSALPQHQRSSQESEILAGVRAYMTSKEIPALWAPKYLVPVEAIPVLATGKLDLRSCRLLAQEALQTER